MKTKISAVVNTHNEEEHIVDCLKSLHFVDEIILVDTESTDATVKLAKIFTKHIYQHKYVGYVEPVRNFAISKATNPWVLVVDADERVPQTLAAKLIEIATDNSYDFVRLPRQNFIFGSWVQHSRWWPDYNIRFFRKGAVNWQNSIHSIPITEGHGTSLEATPELSLIHLHYKDIDQYLERNLRYSSQQAKELIEAGYQFDALDLVTKPIGEFIGRFFAGEGYLDGLHGLVLASLQAFSILFVYLKVWQYQGMKPRPHQEFNSVWQNGLLAKTKELRYWYLTSKIQHTPSRIKQTVLKIVRKFYR